MLLGLHIPINERQVEKPAGELFTDASYLDLLPSTLSASSRPEFT